MHLFKKFEPLMHLHIGDHNVQSLLKVSFVPAPKFVFANKNWKPDDLSGWKFLHTSELVICVANFSPSKCT
jgi:hypothetical protein